MVLIREDYDDYTAVMYWWLASLAATFDSGSP